MSEPISIRREEELFDAASRLDGAAAQRLYLAAASPKNAALRQRVEELLKLRAAADKFFVQTHEAMPLSAPTLYPPALSQPNATAGERP